MNKYNFDKLVNRRGTYSIKWGDAEVAESLGIARKTNDETIPMMVADMDFECPPALIKAMHEVADFGIYGYTMTLAAPEYNKAVISWYKRRYNTEVKPEEIIYCNGSVEAVSHAIRAFSSVGDGVIICRPVYGHFSGMIEECYRKIVPVSLINDGSGYYTMDFEAFEAVCAVPTNKVFVLCSPANPVGRVWTSDELRCMAEICRKHHVLLVSDEVHSDIVRRGVTHRTIFSAAGDTSNIILVSAVNKTFNVAGLQCANVIIPDKNLRGIFCKDFGMRMPTPFAIAALIAAYNGSEDWVDELNAYIDGNIEAALGFFREHMPKLRVWRPEGTYMLWLDFSAYGIDGAEIHRMIYDRANVLLQDGTVHDPEHGSLFQRMCLGCPRSILQTALKRIAREFDAATI